ncbi:MAG TPA: hypothetical protein VGS21_01515, partial [Acidimicrobiales bacterium]|nr:hypothetical protein [Acidimicrobiales bacterium]
GSTTTIPRQHPSGGGPTYLVCGRPVSAPGEVSFVVGASAARLSAEVTVSALPPEHRCIALTSGANLHIRIGDRIQFVANSTPRFSNNLSNGGLFSVQTSPGPTATGALPTTHVIVTLTAVAPGSVTLGWTDCSGTAC